MVDLIFSFSGPAIGLGVAFGVIFGFFVCLVLFFTIKAACTATNKKTRLIEPNNDIEKVLHKNGPDVNTIDGSKYNVYIVS